MRPARIEQRFDGLNFVVPVRQTLAQATAARPSCLGADIGRLVARGYAKLAVYIDQALRCLPSWASGAMLFGALLPVSLCNGFLPVGAMT